MKTFKHYILENHQRTLFLVRGLPGSGKSTHARSLVRPDNHFEADQFFMRDGKYNFDPTKLRDAHADCLARTNAAMTHPDATNVAVSNTFTQAWELKPYLDLAKQHGWNTQIIRMGGDYGSIHGVPPESIDRMRSRFEDIPSETKL